MKRRVWKRSEWKKDECMIKIRVTVWGCLVIAILSDAVEYLSLFNLLFPCSYAGSVICINVFLLTLKKNCVKRNIKKWINIVVCVYIYIYISLYYYYYYYYQTWIDWFLYFSCACALLENLSVSDCLTWFSAEWRFDANSVLVRDFSFNILFVLFTHYSLIFDLFFSPISRHCKSFTMSDYLLLLYQNVRFSLDFMVCYKLWLIWTRRDCTIPLNYYWSGFATCMSLWTF